MLNKQSLWSLSGGVIPAFAALVAIPAMVSMLGFNLFAITSLILSIAVFFYVYDLGMSRTMTYLISKNQLKNSAVQDDLVGAAIISAFVLGLILTLIIYIFIPYFVMYWMNVSLGLFDEAIVAFKVSTLGILPGVVANTFKGVLEGKSKFKEANICKIISGTSIFIAPVVIIYFDNKNLIDISASIVFTRYLSLFIYAVYSIRLTDLINIKLRFNYFESILKYGKWAAISGLISTSFVYGDRFLVAGYLSVEELSAYISSQDVLIRYLLIPWSMATVLMPVFGANNIAKNKLLTLYRTQQKHVAIISFVILLAALVLAFFLTSHISHSLIPKDIVQVAAIQIVGIFFCAMTQLPLIYLYARGMPKLVTKIYFAELIIYILVAPLVFTNLGLLGACLIWSGRLIMEYLLLSYFAGRLINGEKFLLNE